MTFKGKGKV